MGNKDRNQARLQEKHKLFLHYYYSEGKTLHESYNLSHKKTLPEKTASSRGYMVKQYLETFEDFRDIIRQFSPIPTLGAHMADIAFNSKDPNLRYKGQTHITRVLGLQEPEVGTVQGFTINIAGAKQAIQVNQGDSSDSDAKTTQPKKLGRPISFIK